MMTRETLENMQEELRWHDLLEAILRSPYDAASLELRSPQGVAVLRLDSFPMEYAERLQGSLRTLRDESRDRLIKFGFSFEELIEEAA
jgi:hypothetical protein